MRIVDEQGPGLKLAMPNGIVWHVDRDAESSGPGVHVEVGFQADLESNRRVNGHRSGVYVHVHVPGSLGARAQGARLRNPDAGPAAGSAAAVRLWPAPRRTGTPSMPAVPWDLVLGLECGNAPSHVQAAVHMPRRFQSKRPHRAVAHCPPPAYPAGLDPPTPPVDAAVDDCSCAKKLIMLHIRPIGS